MVLLPTLFFFTPLFKLQMPKNMYMPTDTTLPQRLLPRIFLRLFLVSPPLGSGFSSLYSPLGVWARIYYGCVLPKLAFYKRKMVKM